MKTTLPLALFAAGALSADGAIVIHNQDNPPTATDLPSGGWGTYRGFSVSFSDAALSTAYTSPDSAPTPGTIYLGELTLRHPGTQGSGSSAPGDWTNALVKVYSSQTPTTGTFVGDSTNVQDMSQAGSERNVSFTFGNLAIDPTATYWFYFSNTAGNVEPGDQTWTSGRLRVSNNANHTYGSGNLWNASFAAQDTAFDPVFSATFSSVPEPSAALLGGLGALALLRRRRA